MSGGRIPGPLGKNYDSADAQKPQWDLDGYRNAHVPGPIGAHPHRPVRVADAGKKTGTIILNIYMPITDSFTSTKFHNWLEGISDDENWDDGRLHDPQIGHFEEEDINLEFYTTVRTGVDDFKKSLLRTGAVVVYLGHAWLDPHDHSSRGLTPQEKKEAPEIPSQELRALLMKSTAALVIIASCDSMTAVGTPNSGPAIIVTDSGKNKKTWSTHWARALGAFFFRLIGLHLDASEQPAMQNKGNHGTINEALKASDDEFAKVKEDDRFKLVHGDGTKVIFP